MLVTHEVVIWRRCPVDDGIDCYTVQVEAHKLVKVETILDAIRALREKVFQEVLTQDLAAALGCRVTTVGYHSGVKTVCTCG